MDCGHSVLKYILFFFNFLFWILGIVVMGVGIYSRVNSSNYDTLLGDGGISSAANILIVSGIFVSLIGFVGCCGALKESKTMLIIYFILVLLIFILEIAAGILAYTKKDLMEKHLASNLVTVVKENYGKANPDTATKALMKALDWFQQEVKCCGYDGFGDWSNSTWSEGKAGQLAPKSCCVDESVDKCNESKATVFDTGCVAAGKAFIKDHMWQVGGVGVGIAVVQVLVMAAAISLCRNMGQSGNLA